MTYLLVDCFALWWVLADGRCLAALADCCGIPLERLRRHAEEEQWVRRRRASARVLNDSDAVGMNTRHRSSLIVQKPRNSRGRRNK